VTASRGTLVNMTRPNIVCKEITTVLYDVVSGSSVDFRIAQGNVNFNDEVTALVCLQLSGRINGSNANRVTAVHVTMMPTKPRLECQLCDTFSLPSTKPIYFTSKACV